MAAYAALVSLMNNIEQIQSHNRFPIHFDQKQSETLLEKVYFLIHFLENYYSPRVCKEMEDLESRITDAAYAAEDIIETHVVDTIHAHSRSRKGKNKVMTYLRCIFNQKKNTTQTDEKNPYLPGIEKVTEEMDFIKEEAMKIKDTSDIDGSRTMNPTHAPSSSSTTVGKNAMVGLDHELNELLERLHGHHSSLQVISIVGMGGKGKTTLARTAYEKPLIFDFRAWVSISQEYSLRQILLGLLSTAESSETEEEQLGERLYKKLFGRRYLLVLDDIWSAEVWNRVKRFLPDNNNGSRIIVTTRISSLATDFGWCNLEVNFLDEEKGWNLFCEKVFGQECCPHELKEVGREIVKNCRGLPLSIIVIGGLLANSERTKKYWEYIARDTNAIISLEEDELCMKILYLSYHNLPVHLKSCFLYMGVFPEDTEIEVSILIKQWVAEGFLKRNSSKELEIVAKEYLDDLITRNLLIVRGHGRRGRINRFMIHDLLRNLCLKEARKEKFLYGPTMHNKYSLQSICLLWNLPILTVHGIEEKSIAPLEIWELTELRHLEFLGRYYISLPDPPPPNQQMNTMKNLQKIKGIINFRLSDEVVRRIPNIKTLKVYYDLTGKELEEICLKSLRLLENLESLSLRFYQQLGSDLLSNLTFPNSLNKLSLLGCGFHWEDMSTIASLPYLQVLKLFWNAFTGRKWVLNEEVFRSLKFLQIDSCNDLVEWIADDTHFPSLEHLQLMFLEKLDEIPSGIGDIPTLQMIGLSYCSKSVVDSAKNILEKQEESGNVDLQVKVVRGLPDPPPPNQKMNTMKNLQTIKGINNFRLSDEVVRRIPNIKTLKLCYDLTGKELEEMCLKSLNLLENLESLTLRFRQQIGSDLLSNLTFPISLNKLTLEGCGLHWEDMSTIASLPHLQVLNLKSNAFIGHKWVLNEEEEFHSLKFLKIYSCNDLVEWIAEYADFHFPCLEQLHLWGLDKLEEIPSDIGDIPTLQMIELRVCSKSVVISAKKIMEKQEELGNVDLHVRVLLRRGDDELKGLASDNFLVNKR